MKRTGLFIALMAGLLLAACGQAPRGDPAPAVERYLQAKAAGEAETIGRLLCKEMEADFALEAQAFAGLEGVQVEGLACEQAGDQPEVVRCQGKIVAVYGTEASEFPFTAYRVVFEGGEWKWCGEAP